MTPSRTKALLASTVLFACASIAVAQIAQIDPQTPVSSDGRVSPRPEAAMSSAVSESFEGLGPALTRIGAQFDETGAVVDGAEEVTESAQDVWALWQAGATSPRGLWGGSIIGTDSRILVSPTTVFPARAIGLVTFTGGFCTGWLIGKDTVVTAGHCVHSGGSGGTWRTSVRFYPGRNGSSAPYGSCTARLLHSVTGWTGSADERYDYGSIKLNCTVGNTTGWFGFFSQSATLTGLPTTVAGYPDDKPLTQWKATGTVAVTQDRQLFYKNDTRPGQSGSPVYYNRSGCGICSMAIHAYGVHGASPHSTNNHGTRIISAVYNNLLAWKNEL